MTEDIRQSICDSMIASLLSIKRGGVPDSELVEKLESLKNSVDNFLEAAELMEKGSPPGTGEGYVSGC